MRDVEETLMFGKGKERYIFISQQNEMSELIKQAKNKNKEYTVSYLF